MADPSTTSTSAPPPPPPESTVPQQGEQQQQKHYIPASSCKSLITRVLTSAGVLPANAEIVAHGLVSADLRGVDTHGINRIPSYMARVSQGVLDPAATPLLSEVTPVVASVDGRNGFGALAADAAVRKAVEMARTFGIGMVGVKGSNHFGMSAWVVQRAIDEGMMSL